MWIAHVPYSEADGCLKLLYDRIKGPDDNVDNIMLAHSLRPHTMEGHMAIYKYVLHHASNATPKWFLETLGVYVSQLNGCAYCVDHHFSGLIRLVGVERANVLRTAIETDALATVFNEQEVAAFRYAEALTRTPQANDALCGHVEAMRKAGVDDGCILEVNQVVAYFNYANRTVLGLGVTTDGDILGLSPGNSDNPNDWSHR